MSEVKMLTAPVPNVPWQERPQGPQNGAPIWRYSENPIIGRNPLKGVARIFNSAVMPYGDAFTDESIPLVCFHRCVPWRADQWYSIYLSWTQQRCHPLGF